MYIQSVLKLYKRQCSSLLLRQCLRQESVHFSSAVSEYHTEGLQVRLIMMESVRHNFEDMECEHNC